MPKFSNGKITSSVIFYNRGIPKTDKTFGAYASITPTEKKNETKRSYGLYIL